MVRPGLLALLLATLPGAAEAQVAEAHPPIEAIEIRRVNVFSEDEAGEAFLPYGLANAIHAVTRERVIRRQLLFDVGDPLDPARLEETERLLRAFRLFRKVSVERQGEKVVVETRDAWTLIPRVAFGRKGGLNTFELGVEEANLLGTARRVQARYEKEVERSLWSLLYVDPQALGAHGSVRVLAQDLSDGEALQVEAASPFYALDVARAGAATYRFHNFDAIRYAGGEEVSRWKERSYAVRAQGGALLWNGEQSALRGIASLEWDDTRLEAGSFGPAPPAEPLRRFLFLGVGLESEGRRWLKLRNVDQIDRDEDFNLAPTFAIEAAAAPRVSGARAAGRFRGGGSAGVDWPWGFALGSLSGETRLDGGPRASRLGAEVRAYAVRQGITLAARVAYTRLGRPDPEQFLELDGLNGMRGYRAHAISGTERFVANLEARLFAFSDVLHLFSLGAACFYDEGFSSGAPDRYQRVTDAGVGLRLGLTRASQHALLRIDLARSLRPDPQGRTGWLLSFATGQAF